MDILNKSMNSMQKQQFLYQRCINSCTRFPRFLQRSFLLCGLLARRLAENHLRKQASTIELSIKYNKVKLP